MTEETKDKPKFVTGFAVLVGENGHMFVERNTQVFSVELEREASLLEIRRFCSDIVMDLQAQSAAEYVALRLEAAKKSE